MKFLQLKTPQQYRKELEERLAPLREEALRELGTSRSIFNDTRPTDIGTIRLVDTFLWQRDGRPGCGGKLKAILIAFIIIGVVTVPFLLGSLHGPIPWVGFITLGVIFLLSIPMLIRDPVYTDFFVGERGCAIINFRGTRKNILSRHVFHYANYNILLLGEQIQGEPLKSGGESDNYYQTLFTAGLFNIRFVHSSERYTCDGFDQGIYLTSHPGRGIAEAQYNFWSTADEYWTKRQIEKYFGEDSGPFLRQTFYTFQLEPGTKAPRTFRATPYLQVSEEGLTFDGQLCSWETFSSVTLSRYVHAFLLVISFNDGTTMTLNVEALGNRSLLLTIISHFTGLQTRVLEED